jgi:hypothetical protein
MESAEERAKKVFEAAHVRFQVEWRKFLLNGQISCFTSTKALPTAYNDSNDDDVDEIKIYMCIFGTEEK